AGLADAVLIVNLPGSSGGGRDGMAGVGPPLRPARRPGRGGGPPPPHPPPPRPGPGRGGALLGHQNEGAGGGGGVGGGGGGRRGGGPAGSVRGVASRLGAGNDDPVGHMRGWPVSITEPSLLDAPVGLRPVRARDARVWRDSRVRNAAWLRPWEPTNPET